jgi:hypothetical protein
MTGEGEIAAAIRERRAEAARILRGVAELFSRPGTWTQHAWARDASGATLTRVFEAGACCWCLLGGIKRMRGPAMSQSEDLARGALRQVLQLRGGETIAGWNDRPGQTAERVRGVCIEAAERLEAMT